MTESLLTIAAPKGSSVRIADFAILKLFEGTTFANVNPTKPEGIKTTKYNIEILVEIKRFLSHSLEGVHFTKQMLEMIQTAKLDVGTQAALLFETHKDVKFVIAIATSGDYWCHATLKHENIDQTLLKDMAIDLTYNHNYEPPLWTAPLPVEKSLENLNKLFREICK